MLALVAAVAACLAVAASEAPDAVGTELSASQSRADAAAAARLEALAELRDEPVMLNPSTSHHYKPPPPKRQVRPLTRWEPRGGFLTPAEERLACAGFVGAIACIHLVGALLGMPATTRAQRMRVVAVSPGPTVVTGGGDSPQQPRRRDHHQQQSDQRPGTLSLIKKRRAAAAAAASSHSPSPSSRAHSTNAGGWLWAACTAWFDRVEWTGRVLQVAMPPGRPCIKQRVVIDAFKGATLPWLVWMMWWCKNTSSSAVVISALHGSYGLLWCMKSQIFPDPSWERPVTVLSAIINGCWLAGYWGAAFLIIAGRLELSPLRMGISIVLYVVGVVMMMCADTQKYYMLSLRRGLIVEGWFARCRNTNYLGEMILYAAFAVQAQSLLYWTFLLATWSHVFLPNIYWKELSLMRKTGWERYGRTSSIILPKLLPAEPADVGAATDDDADGEDENAEHAGEGEEDDSSSSLYMIGGAILLFLLHGYAIVCYMTGGGAVAIM